MFGSFLGTITFIIGGLLLTVAIGWSDMCQFMDIVKDDFTKYLGEQAGKGLDACYNDVPLIVAFNMTASLDFAGPIEAQLASIGEMDVAEQFGAVKLPIIELGETIAAITITDEVAAFSQLTSIGESLEDELYSQTEGLWVISEETIEDPDGNVFHAVDVDGQFVVVEWDDVDDQPAPEMAYDNDLNQEVPTGNPIFVAWPDWNKCCYDDVYTEENIMMPWKDNLGKTVMPCSPGTAYARIGGETAVEYMTRLYGAPACEEVGGVEINSNIALAYSTMFDLLVAKDGMLADLGTDAAFCETHTCPTPELGYDTTILAAMNNYESLMEGLVNDFDAMGSSLVGELISHVQDFACNMKCGFVSAFMDELQQNWCVDMLSGFLDIAVSLVLLAVFNIPVCICSAILVNRFRGKWRVSCGSQVFAGADEGGRSVGKGKYDEAGNEIEMVEGEGGETAPDAAAEEPAELA
jgi:hypothetical protein